MKSNEIKELRNLDITKLEEKLSELSVQLTSAYLAKNARKLKNVSLIKNIRADIARIKTVLTMKKAESKD
jgi:large subunit ribosomal protein L29